MSMGTLLYYAINYFDVVTFIYRFVIMSIIKLIKNYSLIYLIDIGTQHKQYTHSEDNVSPYSITSFYHVMKVSLVDCLTFESVIHLIKLNTDNYIYDILTFIPLSFLFEIIFDFIHYTMHRLCHINKYLYQYIHKEHHKNNNISIITTYHQNVIDVILTNSLPIIISAYFIRMSLFQFSIMMIYKTFIEISGHTGKHLYPISSFPQFIWLPKLLKMELYAEDHNIHHTNNKYNFSKRFSLFDKLFGTYKSYNK